jgi:hypothetical protein
MYLSVVMRFSSCSHYRRHPRRWYSSIPSFRGPLDRLKFRNEGERQRGRASLPAMSETYIDAVPFEIARVGTIGVLHAMGGHLQPVRGASSAGRRCVAVC